MFESFSKTYESTVRTLTIIWVVIWSVINLTNYGTSLVTYESLSGADKGVWLFNSLGAFVGFVVGILLIFLLAGVGSKIMKSKKVTTITLITIMSCVYFILPSMADIFGTAVFAPAAFINKLPKTIIWLLPSITFLLLSIFYTVNLSKYNEELETNTVK
jgi:hypothetical protein